MAIFATKIPCKRQLAGENCVKDDSSLKCAAF